MNSEVSCKLFDLIDTIEKNNKIIHMKKLKKIIKEDKQLKKDLEKFHEIMENEYSSEYIELKKKILENKAVSEYRILENELYFVVLDINNKLKNLIDKRKCSN